MKKSNERITITPLVLAVLFLAICFWSYYIDDRDGALAYMIAAQVWAGVQIIISKINETENDSE